MRCRICAAINNAKIFLQIQQEFGSFDRYLWHFTNGKTQKYNIFPCLAKNELSDTISKDLKKRGMKFVGTTIIYSYLQAIGVIYSHDKECFMYREK